MVRLCTLLVVVMAYMHAQRFGSLCSDSSIGIDLSKKGRMMDYVRFCQSMIQTESPDLGALTLKVTDDDNLLLSILLVKKIPANKILESIVGAHNKQRRRSYAMEHFRWGKPSGRKRRPVKVFASSQKGGGPSESSFPPQARRQLKSHEDEVKGNLNGESHQTQGLPRARVSSQSHVQFRPQRRKYGTYQMTHFRWGRPSVSKRNGNVGKTWAEKPFKQLTKRLSKIIVKDLRRITGRVDDREKGEGPVLV